ncbi:hypothetical protein ACHHYP_03887 [Achlya hypogyna]|uniref:Uncharacterized protein n=1 Tax=Achlya hypogyna TaxID=1202772 RepID=A0A1V9ZPN3_ACHHY|nr:hypothetical protein ACHHYP_03887 [Achlya hypogyna]
MRTGPLANALIRAQPAMRGSATPSSTSTATTAASTPTGWARLPPPPPPPQLLAHPTGLREPSWAPVLPRRACSAKPSPSPALPMPPVAPTSSIENPFGEWSEYRSAPREPNPASDDGGLSDDDEFDLGPPPTSLPRLSGCSTDSDGCFDDDHFHHPSLGSRRAKAIEQAQIQFRCFELDCLLDEDHVAPPVLTREHATLFVHQEMVPLVCMKCGRVESVAITY